MIPNEIKNSLKKQHYELAGEHSAVQVCRWAKKSIRGEGVCYKEKFYGIKSHLCCQMSPAVVWCPNECLHCWRAMELTQGDKINGKIDEPKEIIKKCVEAQRKLLLGFKNHRVTDMVKYNEAQEPMQFAISLSGEPFVYEDIGGLIRELRNMRKTSFLVTNGLYPEKIKGLGCFPTQFYVSVNAPNKEIYEKIHNSKMKDAWERLNQTLELFSGLPCRTVFRMNLVRDLNMQDVKGYAELIRKSNPKFIEVKGFMSVGFARHRLGYERMPDFDEVMLFAKELEKELVGEGYKILDEHEFSRVIVLGRDEKDLKIKEI